MADLQTMQRLTEQQAEILRSWLSGHDARTVARAKRLEVGYVGRVLDEVCNYNRQQGQEVLDTGMYMPRPVPQTTGTVRTPTAPKPVPDRFVSPPPPPVDEVPTPEPEPLEEQPEPPTPVPSIDELLEDADASSHGPIRSRAKRIRALAAELAVLVEQHRAEDELRVLVAQRRQALEEATAQLRQVTGKTTPASRPAGTRTSTIRAWARSAGHPIPTHGVLPKSVVDAYYEAHPGVSR